MRRSAGSRRQPGRSLRRGGRTSALRPLARGAGPWPLSDRLSAWFGEQDGWGRIAATCPRSVALEEANPHGRRGRRLQRRRSDDGPGYLGAGRDDHGRMAGHASRRQQIGRGSRGAPKDICAHRLRQPAGRVRNYATRNTSSAGIEASVIDPSNPWLLFTSPPQPPKLDHAVDITTLAQNFARLSPCDSSSTATSSAGRQFFWDATRPSAPGLTDLRGAAETSDRRRHRHRLAPSTRLRRPTSSVPSTSTRAHLPVLSLNSSPPAPQGDARTPAGPGAASEAVTREQGRRRQASSIIIPPARVGDAARPLVEETHSCSTTRASGVL